MPTVLIVSPHFPPADAADMHRIRLSLPYFREFGWDPIILAVDPLYDECVQEKRFLETIPQDLQTFAFGLSPQAGLAALVLEILLSEPFLSSTAPVLKYCALAESI